MTETTPETGPITFMSGHFRCKLVAQPFADLAGPRDAKPADLAAAGYTSNAECARALGDLQQAHLRELAEARAEVEETTEALRLSVATVEALRSERDHYVHEANRLGRELAAERAKREQVASVAREIVEMSSASDGSVFGSRVTKAMLLRLKAVLSVESSPAQPVEDHSPGFRAIPVYSDDRGTLSLGLGGFATVRSCRHCGVLIAGGPTVCVHCARSQPTPTGEPCDHSGSELTIDRATGEETCGDCGYNAARSADAKRANVPEEKGVLVRDRRDDASQRDHEKRHTDAVVPVPELPSVAPDEPIMRHDPATLMWAADYIVANAKTVQDFSGPRASKLFAYLDALRSQPTPTGETATFPALPIDAADEAIVDGLMAKREVLTRPMVATAAEVEHTCRDNACRLLDAALMCKACIAENAAPSPPASQPSHWSECPDCARLGRRCWEHPEPASQPQLPGGLGEVEAFRAELRPLARTTPKPSV